MRVRLTVTARGGLVEVGWQRGAGRTLRAKAMRLIFWRRGSSAYRSAWSLAWSFPCAVLVPRSAGVCTRRQLCVKMEWHATTPAAATVVGTAPRCTAAPRRGTGGSAQLWLWLGPALPRES